MATLVVFVNSKISKCVTAACQNSIPLKNTAHNSKLWVFLFIQIPHNKRLGRIYSSSIGGTTFFKPMQEQNTISQWQRVLDTLKSNKCHNIDNIFITVIQNRMYAGYFLSGVCFLPANSSSVGQNNCPLQLCSAFKKCALRFLWQRSLRQHSPGMLWCAARYKHSNHKYTAPHSILWYHVTIMHMIPGVFSSAFPTLAH